MAIPRRLFVSTVAGALLLPRNGFGQPREDDFVCNIDGVSADEAQSIKGIVRKFMSRHEVPGLALAISHRGQLKLKAGFGHADTSLQTSARPEHLFRVASVSKPITSVTIMRLVELGQLSLDDGVFGKNGLLAKYSDAMAATSYDNRQRAESITLQHLLEHTCGGWGNKTNDPMFAREAIKFDHDRLIRWTLAKRPLEHTPGEDYAYSNFGYCLLGRVIENVTKQSYAEAVRQLVLTPCGINDMKIGRDTKGRRYDNEVTYYGQREDPYHSMMRVSRMDAHGGWVASPIDLVRFAHRVDGYPQQPDIISEATRKVMVTTSSANAGYAKGWNVNKYNNYWHMGSFNGGSSTLVRTNDNHCWAVVVNTRGKQEGYSRDLDRLPWKIKRAVGKWGDHDLLAES